MVVEAVASIHAQIPDSTGVLVKLVDDSVLSIQLIRRLILIVILLVAMISLFNSSWISTLRQRLCRSPWISLRQYFRTPLEDTLDNQSRSDRTSLDFGSSVISRPYPILAASTPKLRGYMWRGRELSENPWRVSTRSPSPVAPRMFLREMSCPV